MSRIIRLVSPTQKKAGVRLPFGHEWARALAVTPDGKLVAAGSPYSGVVLLRLPSRKVWRTLRSDRAGIRALAFSPDGTHLALADEAGRVELWRMGQRK